MKVVKDSKGEFLKEVKEITHENVTAGIILHVTTETNKNHEVIRKEGTIEVVINGVGGDSKANLKSVLPESKYKVDKDGYVTIPASKGRDHVLLPKKASKTISTNPTK